MSRAEPGIDLTTEELVQLAELTGVPLPTGVDDEAFGDAPEAYRGHALSQANRTLRVRGIITENDDGFVTVSPAVTSMIETSARPGLLGVVAVESEGVVETRFFSARPELGVEHQAIAPSVHRFTPFMTRDFLARVLRFSDLRPSDVPVCEPFRLPLTALEEATEFTHNGDRLSAIAALQRSGVRELEARALAAALQDKKATVTVTLLTRPDQDHVVGGMLIWLDGGLKGNWVIERADPMPPDAPVEVDVRPAAAKDIVSELLSYLPDGLSADLT